jgi:hypothetical protein
MISLFEITPTNNRKVKWRKGRFVLLSVQSDENLILGFEEKTVKVQKLFYVAKKM